MFVTRLYRAIRFFFVYRSNILKNKDYLQIKWGLNIDNVNRLWTVINLIDAPEEIKKEFGARQFAENEIKKYISKFKSDLPKLELDELVNVYEIKRIDSDNWGITFGYSLYNNTAIYVTYISLIIAILVSLLFIIF